MWNGYGFFLRQAQSACCFFMSGRFVMEEWIYRCYTDRNMTRSYDEKYILKLQKYISENGISTKEIRKLDDWTEDSRNTYIQIKKEKNMCLPSTGRMRCIFTLRTDAGKIHLQSMIKR